MDHAILPGAPEGGCGRGTGVNPYGRTYPFVTANADAHAILSELRLTHEVRDLVLPLRVAWLWGFDRAFHDPPGGSLGFAGTTATIPAPVHTVDIVIIDTAGTVVFNSTAASVFRTTHLSDCHTHHYWETASGTLKVVQHRGFHGTEQAWAVPRDIRPADGALDERTSIAIPDRVRSVTVLAHDLINGGVNSQAVAGNVALTGGYNTEIATRAAPRGVRTVNQITISAAPGSGRGRKPGCEAPVQQFYSINGVVPDKYGNIAIQGFDCAWERQPIQTMLTHVFPRTAIPTKATTHLGDNCTPCCTCEDFVRVQKGVLRVWKKARRAAFAAEQTRDRFKWIIGRWLADRACRAKRLVQATFTPHGRYYVEFAAAIINNTDHCMLNLQLDIEVLDGSPALDPYPGSVTVIDAYGDMVQYELLQYEELPPETPTYIARWQLIQPQSSAIVRGRLMARKVLKPGTQAVIRLTARQVPETPGQINLPQAIEYTITWK